MVSHLVIRWNLKIEIFGIITFGIANWFDIIFHWHDNFGFHDDFRDRRLDETDETGHEQKECKRASAETFRHFLMECSVLPNVAGLHQRLPARLPDLGASIRPR